MKLLLRLGTYLVALAVCSLCGSSSANAAAKPNIVMIVSDDAAYSDFGFSAALNNRTTQFETPNLDALAQSGVVGSNFYTPVAICSPTRAGLLTGQYPQRVGYEDNLANNINSPLGLTANQTTIAQRLKPLGYTTGIVGKWHLGFIDGVNRPTDKGFDESYGPLGGGRDYWASPGQINAIWKNNQYYESQYTVEGDHSRYDPVNGRYVTDAFGEEAADFVNRHAQDQNPFFLYMPLTGPHAPLQAKQSDLDHFAHIADPTKRTVAAMTYAVDRAVGDVLNSLQANGVADNTIVIFTNDNGAESTITNPPYKGNKGTAWEGGIKVPMIIKAPGLQPSVGNSPRVYNSPFSGYDLLPTLVTAAGGNISQFAHDGTDVMPFLKGQATDDPNRPYITRLQGSWAIREGDWKLVLPQAGPGPHLFNVKNDPEERVFGLYLQYPEILSKLWRDFTNWEATMAKPKWGPLGALNKNLFDHFVFRNDLAATTNWNATNAWLQGGTSNIKTMIPDDAYANGIFEFTTRNDANYTANNNMQRQSSLTFMLNEIRLSGTFNGAVNRQGQLTGNEVLFVKSLTGAGPKIRLDATASGTPATFTFQIDNELQLLNDLEITGNGTQNFRINGSIRDETGWNHVGGVSPHSVRKTGTSQVTLSGNNIFTGGMTVEGGKVIVDGPSAAINGATSIAVGNGAEFSLKSGFVKTPVIGVEAGGLFSVDGGRLETKAIFGDLVMNAGTFVPGYATPAITSITDDFILNAGAVLFEIGGANPGAGYDQLVVHDLAAISGGLQVQFVSGFVPALYQEFRLLTADNLVGNFTTHLLPTLPNGYSWRVLYTTQDITLTVRPPGQSNVINPVGDFNLDGIVDAGDYTLWRDTVGSTTIFAADANGDHLVDSHDYDLWKAHFGEHFNLGLGGGSITNVGVPEPSALLLAAITVLICKCDENLIRRCRKRPHHDSPVA